MKRFLIMSLLLLAGISPSTALADFVYQTPEDFLSEVFDGNPPPSQVLSIFGERKKTAAEILNHPPNMLRSRYWEKGDKIVWILAEIGKVLPISAGFVVQKDELKDVRVLIYRETHGAEIRHSFFTKQFSGSKLEPDKSLSKHIDGISGATLSVGAMKRLAALALFFSEEVKARE